jgi:shikimate dehydrogenase
VANRSLDKAQALVARHAAWADAHGVVLSAAGLDACGTGYAVVLNGTAASLQGAGSPVSGAVLAPGALALDMMYGPAAAPFLQWAREHGAAARDGLGMLVEQAAEAFQVWRGVRPPTAEVLRELRAGLAG